jgi:hypothetical protein
VIGAVLLFFSALQFWRPYFFLTDDNLSGVLPVFADLGNSMRKGIFPITNDALFNGTNNIWRDPGSLTLLFPVHIAAMFLATSAIRLAAIDIICLFHLLVGALAMRACILSLGQRFQREVPSWLAAFLAVSYVASIYSVAVGSSWYNFLGSQASLPLVMLGLLMKRRSTGTAVVTAGVLYGMLGGHMAPFLWAALFLGAFAVLFGLSERTWDPIRRYAIGCVAAGLLVLPVLIPATAGYVGSERAEVISDNAAVLYRLPLAALLFGSTLGVESLANWNFEPELGFLAEVDLPIAFSAAALVFLAVLGSAWRFHRLEWILVAILASLALLLHRPVWLQHVISSIPMYRALRWPMREALIFLFFAHLLVAAGWSRLPRRLGSTLPVLSGVMFCVLLFSSSSPTFNRFPTDRTLLLTGRADDVWRQVIELMPRAQECRVVPLYAPQNGDWMGRFFVKLAPHTLMGGYNYPALFGMKSVTGYVMPGFAQQFRGVMPIFGPGYFPPAFAPADFNDPTLLFTQLHAVDPLTVEYRIGETKVHAVFPHGVESAAVVTRVP